MLSRTHVASFVAQSKPIHSSTRDPSRRTFDCRNSAKRFRKHLDDYFGDHVGSDACKLALDCVCYPCSAWHQNVFLQEMRSFGHAEEAGDIVVTREPGGV
jgi:hypothetical protein